MNQWCSQLEPRADRKWAIGELEPDLEPLEPPKTTEWFKKWFKRQIHATQRLATDFGQNRPILNHSGWFKLWKTHDPSINLLLSNHLQTPTERVWQHHTFPGIHSPPLSSPP